MKRSVLSAGVAAAVSLAAVGFFGPREAEAATILSVNFCPGNSTCPAGITEASLTFEDVVSPDPNDYTLTVKITGNNLAPAFLDAIQVKIEGVKSGVKPGGYEFLPTLSSSPTGPTWTVYWDQINNSGGACDANTGQAQSFCAQSGPPSANGVNQQNVSNVFVFDVDLEGTGTLKVGGAVNLRASFNDAEGKNAGLLSPGGGTLTSSSTSSTASASSSNVPEPATSTLALLGVGLLAGALRQRRKARSA